MDKNIVTVGELPEHKHGYSMSNEGYHNHAVTNQGDVLSLAGSTSSAQYEQGFQNTNGGWWNNTNKDRAEISYVTGHIHNITIETTGNNEYHNNLSPYNVCYIWLRIS